MIFFFYKNKRYSFIQSTLIQYKSKFAKIKKDEFVNKLTAFMLIT